jgi:hypothetical protein
MNSYEVDVTVTVSVIANESKEAQELARLWTGTTINAPESVSFVCAEADEARNEVELCPHCNTNEVNVDDFGITTCDDCLNKHPEWKKLLNELSDDEARSSGHPINEND